MLKNCYQKTIYALAAISVQAFPHTVLLKFVEHMATVFDRSHECVYTTYSHTYVCAGMLDYI